MRLLLVIISCFWFFNICHLSVCLSFIPKALQHTVMVKSKDFVKRIRDDLRRNNDDYRELQLAGARPAPPLPARRRLTLKSVPAPAGSLDNSTSTSLELPQLQHPAPPNVTTSNPTSPATSESSNYTTTTDPSTSSPINATTTPPLGLKMIEEEPDADDQKPVDPKVAKEHNDNQKPVLRAVWDDSGEPSRERAVARLGITEPDVRTMSTRLAVIQLDMAAAKGNRIERLRVQNHLCQRHVMIPEGPKYDSQGKVYLQPYRQSSGAHYFATAPPSLLLPKCCNCCKKSLLGCE